MKTNAIIILDGMGWAAPSPSNAVSRAMTPYLNNLMLTCPNTILGASGLAVGLPKGQIGNSEVGHLNLGAGRVIYQDITRIDKSIEDGDFFTNPAFLTAIKNAKINDGTLHLMGLCSDGGVHSHINHLLALLRLCKQQKFDNIKIHVITDGRDVAPHCRDQFIKQLPKKHIATISGRYYTMDRDNRAERTQLAYDCIVDGKGETKVDESLDDEFVKPTVMGDYKGMQDGDSVIFFNFRSDRARQITQKITASKRVFFVCMTVYDAAFKNVHVAYAPKDITNTLGEVLSKHDLTQVRLAETEKYAHVTYFFNGGIEQQFKGEERVLVQSPKVATYDLAPEMSAQELTQKAIERVGKYDVMIINFANCDMVGHTGKIDPTIVAVETVDKCVAKLVDAILANGGVVFVTSDHGNAEQMTAEDGTPFTAHTTNDVPFIIAGLHKKVSLKSGKLADVAPTFLKILGITPPVDMTGESML